MTTNANDPYSPNTRRVADAFWRACLGEPQTFKSDMKALAAALRQIVREYGTSREDEWLIDANDLLDIADELDDNSEKDFDEVENERHFKECIEAINNLKPGEITELMGEAFMEEFKRVSQR